MSSEQLLPVQTASVNQSIWQAVKLDSFRRHVVALQQASNKIPSDPQEYSARSWLARRTKASESNYVLSIDAEQRLADDLAFIAAAEEGVKTISAVTLEQHVGGAGLTVRLAANETIPEGVPSTFRALFELLSRCACKKFSREKCSESLFDQVIMLSQNRIHGRLQSTFWQSPRHRQHEARTPLYLEIQAVSLRIERLPSSKNKRFGVLSKKLNELCGLFERVDAFAGTSSEAEDLLADVAKQCYAVSTSDGKSTLEETVAGYGYTPNDVCRNKHIRQIYKIGRYWGLCLYMAEASRKYDKLFKNIKLETIRPYRAIISPISFKGPPAKCHVHAEIQLLTFYGSNPNPPALKPRVLGASKAACYLCNLFIKEYAEFFVSKTHGQLYDQWNVPDLATFSGPQRLQYRTVLRNMDTELQTAERRERSRPRMQKRREALGSWLDLTTVFPLSPNASDAGTVLSEAKSDATIPIPSGTETPRTLSAEAIPRSARAERLERRNLLKEVQDTRKVPETSEEHPTTSSPNPARASPITIQPNPVDLPLISAGPSPQPPSLTSPPIASPMPPSPPISTPLPVNHDDLTKPKARIPLHQTPGITSSTAAELPSSPSSSSIQSGEYPIERTIITTSPFRSTHDKLSVTFEIEGTGQGNVAIAHFSGSKGPATGIPINLRAMKENEILHFEREHEEDHLVLNLQHAGNQSTQIKLQWL